MNQQTKKIKLISKKGNVHIDLNLYVLFLLLTGKGNKYPDIIFFLPSSSHMIAVNGTNGTIFMTT